MKLNIVVLLLCLAVLASSDEGASDAENTSDKLPTTTEATVANDSPPEKRSPTKDILELALPVITKIGTQLGTHALDKTGEFLKTMIKDGITGGGKGLLGDVGGHDIKHHGHGFDAEHGHKQTGYGHGQGNHLGFGGDGFGGGHGGGNRGYGFGGDHGGHDYGGGDGYGGGGGDDASYGGHGVDSRIVQVVGGGHGNDYSGYPHASHGLSGGGGHGLGGLGGLFGGHGLHGLLDLGGTIGPGLLLGSALGSLKGLVLSQLLGQKHSDFGGGLFGSNVNYNSHAGGSGGFGIGQLIGLLGGGHKEYGGKHGAVPLKGDKGYGGQNSGAYKNQIGGTGPSQYRGSIGYEKYQPAYSAGPAHGQHFHKENEGYYGSSHGYHKGPVEFPGPSVGPVKGSNGYEGGFASFGGGHDSYYHGDQNRGKDFGHFGGGHDSYHGDQNRGKDFSHFNGGYGGHGPTNYNKDPYSKPPPVRHSETSTHYGKGYGAAPRPHGGKSGYASYSIVYTGSPTYEAMKDYDVEGYKIVPYKGSYKESAQKGYKGEQESSKGTDYVSAIDNGYESYVVKGGYKATGGSSNSRPGEQYGHNNYHGQHSDYSSQGSAKGASFDPRHRYGGYDENTRDNYSSRSEVSESVNNEDVRSVKDVAFEHIEEEPNDSNP